MQPLDEVQLLLAEGTHELASAGIEEAHLEARLLLALAGKCTQVEVLAGHLRLDDGIVSRFRELIAARARRVPYAYLAGMQEFYGLEFQVNQDVLVPRPETELLVDLAVGALRGLPNPVMVDVGTGSGCIVVACAVHVPMLKALAVDVSPGAARVARNNVLRHGVEGRVVVVRGDLLSAVGSRCVDLVASNPPYVASDEIPNLQPEVRCFEPRVALDGGRAGMDYHERLARHARKVLNPGGWLMVETAQGQAHLVAELLNVCGYRQVQTHRDLAGIERVVCGRAD
ncbi:MAG: peptide chain release factor N(5)-glutamine methyltransferase [Chthonomonadales bacterium]